MLDGRVDGFDRHAIFGWAADAERPGDRVDIVVLVNGHVRGGARADRPRDDLQSLGMLGDGAHGFGYAFEPPLSPLRSYEISVRHAATHDPLRLGQFTIAAELSDAVEHIRPILVTGSGQPGLLDLMRSLAGDPGIVAADSHEYGVKLMAYYAHALAVLVVPGKPAPTLGVAADADRDQILQPNPFHAPEYEHLFPQARLLYDFFQNQSEAKIRGAFKDVVTEFYRTLATHQGRPMASYFVEQCGLFDAARGFARLAFPDLREIVLLQDPRDAFCDYRTLWFNAPAQTIETLRRVRDRTIALRHEHRDDTMFLRCEDLRLRPESTLLEIAGFLSLDHTVIADPEMLRAASAAVDDPSMLGITQWGRELNNNEIAMFEREFGEYLELFGYDVSVRGST
jgi:hypothetical protein